MCSEMSSELFHPNRNSVAVVMPLTKVNDTERKHQRRAASPSERGRRSEWAPWSKARDSNRKRQERAPSRTSSADATGQALSKKARALARIRPFVHSFAASITAPVPAQQLKCQPLAFDDSSREAATASGLAIVKAFFEDRNMERPTCACCNELKAPSRTRTVSIEEGESWLARIRTRLTWEHTTFACSAEVIDSTKRLICPRPLCWPGYLWLRAVWPSMSWVQSR